MDIATASSVPLAAIGTNEHSSRQPYYDLTVQGFSILVNSEANSRRISMVESCFGASGQPLAVPGRVLVGEGVLTKMCRKKPKPRQFFLFNDILVYGNIVLNKKKYNKQHVIPLEEVSLTSLEDEGHFRNGWLIKTPTKSFAVYAATATEKAEWMAHITKCVTDLLRKSGKKAAESHAAVWVPDSEAAFCMHCKKTQFTVINRRHHCRKCGNVVCGNCSNKKMLLVHQSRKPLRVCLSCFDDQQGNVDILGAIQDKERANMDSSGEDDSDEDNDEVVSPQSDVPNSQGDVETMTFYGLSETNSSGLVPHHAANDGVMDEPPATIVQTEVA